MADAIIAGLIVVAGGMTGAAWCFGMALNLAQGRARRAEYDREIAQFERQLTENLLQRRRDREAGVKRRAPNGQFAS